MQPSHRIVRKHNANPSARSLLTLAVSDALASCRRVATVPSRRETQAALVMAAAMTFAFVGLPAHAQQASSNWTGEVSGSWFEDGNWSDGVPGELTHAVINTTSPHPTLIDGNDPSGSHATVLNVYVGKGGTGELTIANGGSLASKNLDIGLEGGEGTVTVTGTDSNWSYSGPAGLVIVGNSGTGTLLVEAGGTVSTLFGYIGYEANSVGEVTVTGADSMWLIRYSLHLGSEGAGTLEILDGGLVGSQYGVLGDREDSTGAARVEGADSRWEMAGELIVGHLGAGTLVIRGGGAVSNTERTSFIGNLIGSTGEVTVDGAGSAWTNSGDLYVGNEGSGTLEILDGGHVESASAYIGSVNGSDGKVRVSGVDSAGTRSNWEMSAGPGNDRDLIVGGAGAGTLLVEAGGTVSNKNAFIGNEAGSVGKTTVTGTDSNWTSSESLTVGNVGTGTLLVEVGGTVSNHDGVIGNEAGSVGEATVTGAGSTWANSDDLAVGQMGNGTLTIENGGLASGNIAVIGYGAGSIGKVMVTGADSTWVSGRFYIAEGGTGALTVTNGGAVRSMYSAIGFLPGSIGEVTVASPGSSWLIRDLVIGEEGRGTLTIADGGVVNVAVGDVATSTFLANASGSVGTLNIGAGGAAGIFSTTSISSPSYGGDATINFNHNEADYFFTRDGTAGGIANQITGSVAVNQIGTGTTTLRGLNSYTGATHVNAGTLLVEGSLSNSATTVADGGTLGGTGSIAGNVTLADGGILAPGSSAGTLTLGSLTLSEGSTLDYELGQAGVIGGGINDLVEVTGNLTLDGTLDITDIGGFGAGVYRLINYGGDLIDNGLEIGTRPSGVDANDLSVLTTFAGQVNLASTAGLALTFWDGATAHDNDAIDGGGGTWDAGNSNWTTTNGATNGRWDNGTFAVFGGTAGTVDVVGEQAIAGLQFMSGYTLTAGTDGALRIDGADSVIRVDPDVTATIAAPITGTGGLVKTDTGTLVLSGENTYAGGTRIDLGTLQVAADGNLGDAAGGIAFDGGTLQTTAAFDSTRDVDLQAGGGTFLTDADLGLGGVISGAGTLTKDGDGTLTLTGDNTYTGGTRVLDGTLVGDTGSIRGNLANDGMVVFDQGDDATFVGKISGDGTMGKRGAGVLTLTGSSALDWTIDAGALVSRSALFSGDTRIVDGALLRFDEQGDGRYAGILSGTGAFEIAGDGIFALTGNSAAFTGTTSLQSGTLQLGGALGGSTLIANGAVLGGIGTLHDVDNHGTIAPGNSIGTLMLTGNYLHHDDATLLAEIEPGGDSDLLDIAGSATIEGGTVEIVKLPGQYEGGTRYTLIDAAGGVSGTFGTLDQDLPFLDLLLGYDANHVYLDVQRNEVDFNIVCGDGTFNQCQVASALDRVADGEISDDLKTVLTEVTTLDLSSAQAAFDTLSGEAHASAAGAMLEGHALYGQTVSRRIADRRDETGAGRLQGGAWARGYGMGSELDGDGNAHGARLELYGLAVGVDAWASESWLIGASVNTLKLDADFRAGDGAEADAKNVSLYTSVQGERGYVDAVASFAWWNSEVQRRIAIGSLAREARSDYGMDRIALALEAGLTYDLGNSTLQPLLSVEFNKLSTESFREDGADDVNLIGRSQDVERTVAGAGVRWTGEFSAGTWTFAPTAQARWLHTFGDLSAEFDVAFAGAPDTSFRVRGVTVPEDRGLLGIGLQASRDTLDVFADVDYQAGDGFKSASFGAGLRWRW